MPRKKTLPPPPSEHYEFNSDEIRDLVNAGYRIYDRKSGLHVLPSRA